MTSRARRKRRDRRPSRRGSLAQALCHRPSNCCGLVLEVQVTLRPSVGLLTDLFPIDVVGPMVHRFTAG